MTITQIETRARVRCTCAHTQSQRLKWEEKQAQDHSEMGSNSHKLKTELGPLW